MEAYSFKKYPKKDTYGRFLIQTINPVRSALFITRKKDLYGVELSSSKNNTYDPHWTFKIRDIMNKMLNELKKKVENCLEINRIEKENRKKSK
jgi:hypothetical protein